MTVQEINSWQSFGGEQKVFKHPSATTGTDMEFSIYLPKAASERSCPVLWYLSGLTCTWENVTAKGGFQRAANRMGVIVVCPDTSPRGLDLHGEHEDYDFGSGAGFYVDATRQPWSDHYQMESYIVAELQKLVADQFPIDCERQGIFGHSMGGHGALTLALKNPSLFKSVSAFAPICSPLRCPWGEKALGGYLGSDRSAWRRYDATALIEDGGRVPEIFVDQGMADTFLSEQLRPELLEQACANAGIPLHLRRQAGYDHSYYFISSFMDDHLAYHSAKLN